MENLYYNLSEEEFSKSKKVLLWSFASLFFLGGVYILIAYFVLGHKNMIPVFSAAPFGISLIVGVIASLATFKGTDLYFLIDHDKIEYKYGMFKPVIHTLLWKDIKELVMPHKQKKVKVIYNNGSSFVINLNWIQNNKSALIRKHLFHVAREKDLTVSKVSTLR